MGTTSTPGAEVPGHFVSKLVVQRINPFPLNPLQHKNLPSLIICAFFLICPAQENASLLFPVLESQNTFFFFFESLGWTER